MIAFACIRGMRYSVKILRVDRERDVVVCTCNATRLVLPRSYFWAAGYSSL